MESILETLLRELESDPEPLWYLHAQARIGLSQHALEARLNVAELLFQDGHRDACANEEVGLRTRRGGLLRAVDIQRRNTLRPGTAA